MSTMTDTTGAEDTIGNRIREARKAQGMMQIDLARAIGVDNRQMWRFEAGRVVLSVAKLQAIAAALGCTVDSLLPPIKAQ